MTTDSRKATVHPFTKHRKSKRLSQGELGEKLGIDQSYVSLIETGRRHIPYKRVRSWAKKLGISQKSLMPYVEAE